MAENGGPVEEGGEGLIAPGSYILAGGDGVTPGYERPPHPLISKYLTQVLTLWGILDRHQHSRDEQHTHSSFLAAHRHTVARRRAGGCPVAQSTCDHCHPGL